MYNDKQVSCSSSSSTHVPVVFTMLSRCCISTYSEAIGRHADDVPMNTISLPITAKSDDL